MIKNMGKTDRMLRMLLAVLIVVLYLTDQLTGTASVILGMVAIAFLLTSVGGICPLYLPFKLSTNKKHKE